MTPEPADGQKEDGLPRYMQVASTLRTAILRGVYPVGSRVPTEEALCRHFKVSRHTIREALRQLRSDGLIASTPGSRPVVAPPALPGQADFFAGEGGFDYMLGTRLAIDAMDLAPLDRDLAEETGLPQSEQWLSIKGYRISVDDGQATCWNEYVVAAEYAMIGRILARHVGPVVPLLEDLFSLRIARITRSMSAVALPGAQAEGFRADPGSPALRILTRCETPDGRVALLNRSLHPTGQFSYAIQR